MKKDEALYKFKRAMIRYNLGKSTIDNYCRMVGQYIDYCETKQFKTRKEYVDNFIIRLTFQRRSSKSINLYIAALNKYFELVRANGKKIQQIPCIKEEKYLPDFITTQEAERMFAVVKNHKHKLLLALTYNCGLRVSEVVSIRNKNIYLDSNLIRIYGKGRKERLVPIQDIPRGLLVFYMNDGEWLFPGQKRGQHLSIRSAEKIFKKAIRLAGIPREMGIHALRHSCATYMLGENYNLRIIQEMLGHSSTRTTEKYTHVQKNHLTKTSCPMSRIAI
jgi:site-specific recombinase XerD